jgi:hypothetical protein
MSMTPTNRAASIQPYLISAGNRSMCLLLNDVRCPNRVVTALDKLSLGVRLGQRLCENNLRKINVVNALLLSTNIDFKVGS